jgi:hypothetical protein
MNLNFAKCEKRLLNFTLYLYIKYCRTVESMNRQTAMAAVMLVSMTLVLAALAAVPAMNNLVFADRDECKLPNGGDFPGQGVKCPPGLDEEEEEEDSRR